MNRRFFLASVSGAAALQVSRTGWALNARPSSEVEITLKEAPGGATATVLIPRASAVAFVYQGQNEGEGYREYCAKFLSKDFPRPKLQLDMDVHVVAKNATTLGVHAAFKSPTIGRLVVNGMTTGSVDLDEAGTLLKTRIEKSTRIPVSNEPGAVKETLLGTWQIKQLDGTARTLSWKCFVAQSSEAILKGVKMASARPWTFDLPTGTVIGGRP